jgi:hypothetical protein
MKNLSLALLLTVAIAASAQAQRKQQVHVECNHDRDSGGGRFFCETLNAAIGKSSGYALQPEDRQGQWTISTSFVGNQLGSSGSVVLLYEAPTGSLFHNHWVLQFAPKAAKEQAEGLWAEIAGMITADPDGAVKPAPPAK